MRLFVFSFVMLAVNSIALYWDKVVTVYLLTSLEHFQQFPKCFINKFDIGKFVLHYYAYNNACNYYMYSNYI